MSGPSNNTNITPADANVRFDDMGVLQRFNSSLATPECLAHRLHNAIIESHVVASGAITEQATLYAIPYALMPISIIIACVGHKMLRPSVMLMSFCVGSAAVLHLMYTYNWVHTFSCDAVVIASIVSGVVASLLAAAVVRSMSFGLGWFGGAALVVLFFDACEACNEAPFADSPKFLGRHVATFWASLMSVGTISGCVCRGQHTRIVALVTALIGGWGVATSVRLLVGNRDPRGYQAVAPWGYLIISLGSAAFGFTVQNLIITRQNKKRKEDRRKKKRKAVAEPPPPQLPTHTRYEEGDSDSTDS